MGTGDIAYYQTIRITLESLRKRLSKHLGPSSFHLDPSGPRQVSFSLHKACWWGSIRGNMGTFLQRIVVRLHAAITFDCNEDCCAGISRNRFLLNLARKRPAKALKKPSGHSLGSDLSWRE